MARMSGGMAHSSAMRKVAGADSRAVMLYVDSTSTTPPATVWAVAQAAAIK